MDNTINHYNDWIIDFKRVNELTTSIYSKKEDEKYFSDG